MTEQQHPITPPSELVQQWHDAWIDAKVKHDGLVDFIATHAAHWGSDQELEACCEWLREARNHGLGYDMGRILADKLRAARRPKPPSLAENVSKALDRLPGPGADASYLRIWADKEAYGLRCAVRRALERLQELEKGNE